MRRPKALEAEPTDAASEKRISGETLNTRPIERPGEVLEAAPGLIVTQHSGEGKANQYFLRGINLDHGTDLAIWLDGMPVNMRTHGHGQGYADINFIIPELIERMTVKKGPYWAEEGDFASAGSLRLAYADGLERNVDAGDGRQLRLAGVASPPAPPQLGAGLAHRCRRGRCASTGPGTPRRSAQVQRLPALQRRDARRRPGRHGARPIPTPGIRPTRFLCAPSSNGSLAASAGSIRPTAATPSAIRCRSLEAERRRGAPRSSTPTALFDLNLFNNFTYFLDDPDLGDQFQQADDARSSASMPATCFGTSWPASKPETTIGAQIRYDDIGVGLFNTFERMCSTTVRYNQVAKQASASPPGHEALDRLDAPISACAATYSWRRWTATSRPTLVYLGLPGSPKLSLVFGPWDRTEFYLNAGFGFHSNDARGTAITVDPDPSAAVHRVPLLVRSKGAEVGVRTQASQRPSIVLCVLLNFNSELLFIGDAGTTDPAVRPTAGRGVDLTYRPRGWLWLDLDAAYTHARFLEDDTGRARPLHTRRDGGRRIRRG